MIRIIKGRYKNLSMRFDEYGNLIIKAPRFVKDSDIEKFIEDKQNWINKQKDKIKQINKEKEKFDFKNNIYLFGKPVNLLYTDKKEEYYKLFNTYIINLVEDISNDIKLKYSSLTITNSRRIWGSFDRKCNMKLNLKLVVLPIHLVKYVIIHELCHGVEFNHSKEFWKRVEKYCPNFKSIKKELGLLSFVLSEDIFK